MIRLSHFQSASSNGTKKCNFSMKVADMFYKALCNSHIASLPSFKENMDHVCLTLILSGSCQDGGNMTRKAILSHQWTSVEINWSNDNNMIKLKETDVWKLSWSKIKWFYHSKRLKIWKLVISGQYFQSNYVLQFPLYQLQHLPVPPPLTCTIPAYIWYWQMHIMPN